MHTTVACYEFEAHTGWVPRQRSSLQRTDRTSPLAPGRRRGLTAAERAVAMPTSAGEAHPPRPAQRGSLQRVTVNLTPRSCEALELAVKQARDSQTDTINRALQVYS